MLPAVSVTVGHPGQGSYYCTLQCGCVVGGVQESRTRVQLRGAVGEIGTIGKYDSN